MADSDNSERPLNVPIGRSLLKGSAMHMVAFAAFFVSAFFIMPFLIRHLGDRGYGLWVVIGTIVGQFGVMDAGLMSTTMRFMANAMARKADDECIAIFSTSMAIFWLIATTVFASVCVVALTAKLWLTNPTELFEFQIALVILGVNLAMTFPFAVIQGTLTAALRADAAMIAQVICALVRVVLTIAAIEAGFSLIGLAVANLIASLFQRWVLLTMMRRHLPAVKYMWSAVDWKTAKELLAFGRFVFLTNIMDTARSRLHNLIIAGFVTISAVTHYSVAIRLVDYLQEIPSRLTTVAAPIYAAHFARGEMAELRENFLMLSRLTAIICCVFTGGAILFGHRFFRLWLGPGFDDSYYALVVLLSGMFFTFLQTPARSVLRAIYKLSFDTNTNGIEVLVNLGSAFFLIPRFGILGAAMSLAAPMLVVKGFVLPFYVCRTIHLGFLRYYWSIGRYAFATAAIAAIAALLLPLNRIGNLFFLIAIGFAFSMFLLMVLLFMLPAPDKLRLADAIGHRRIQKFPGGKIIASMLLWRQSAKLDFNRQRSS